MSTLRNLFAGIGCLVVLAVLLLVAWLYRAEIERWFGGRTDVVLEEPSPELAESAEEKVRRFVEDGREAELRLEEVELQSWVRYRLGAGLPAGVYNPTVAMRDTSLEMSADLDLNQLSAGASAAEGLRRFMGDSARVTTVLHPRVAEPGVGAVTVMSLQAGMVPVPPPFIPFVLRNSGFRTDGPGRSILFDLPPGVTGMWVDGDELVLTRGDP